MNPYDTWLKSFAIGLETISKGIHSIAKTIYDMANAQPHEKPAKAEPEPIKTEKQPSAATGKDNLQGTDTMPANDQVREVVQKSETGGDDVKMAKQTGLKTDQEQIRTETPRKKATKKGKPQAIKAIPATDQVLEVIKKSGAGVDNVTISKQTGLNQKQVSSALLRLKKYGKVKSLKRGVHTAV